MFHNPIYGVMTILRGILKQFTQLPVAQAFPDQRFVGRRQMPTWRSGRHVFSHKIMVLMTGAASQTGDTLAFTPTPDVHCVPMTVVSLAGKVST
jgi:hypothetical protein